MNRSYDGTVFTNTRHGVAERFLRLQERAMTCWDSERYKCECMGQWQEDPAKKGVAILGRSL